MIPVVFFRLRGSFAFDVEAPVGGALTIGVCGVPSPALAGIGMADGVKRLSTRAAAKI
jgi:hypothetical protein